MKYMNFCLLKERKAINGSFSFEFTADKSVAKKMVDVFIDAMLDGLK